MSSLRLLHRMQIFELIIPTRSHTRSQRRVIALMESTAVEALLVQHKEQVRRLDGGRGWLIPKVEQMEAVQARQDL